MLKLINALQSADDEYLIALSNKGTVKRSYKDLNNTEISAEYLEDSVCVSVSDEKCTIVPTLAESKCTCPSRSICRHIVTAILWLKNNFTETSDDSSQPADTAKPQETQETSQTEESSQTTENPLPQNLTDELSCFPLKEIQKAMKKRYYNAFIEKAEKGIFPHMEELRMVTVDIPEENVIVKLINPLAYSACTCHSKDLCRHKATAILTWQLKHGIVTLENIRPNDEKNLNLDIQHIHDTATYTYAFLGDILANGLVRISDDIVENTESVAVMCHNARLADCERMTREIKNRLQAYVLHQPEFKAESLFSLIIENLLLLEKIIHTDVPETLNNYLGEFKSSYELFDSIEIIPIAWRKFSSVAGYKGEIYYFINKDTQSENRYLTYSDIRPDFYENTRKKGLSQAPWGLFGTVREIAKSELRLKLPRLSGGKISASNETSATIINKVSFNQKAVYDNIYTDFARMVCDIFSEKAKSDNETDHLVMFVIKKCVRSEFNDIQQTQNIVVEDEFNHIITIRATYSADNKEFIQQLITLGEAMLKDTNRLLFQKQFVIFGSIYMEDGQAFVYPIAVFDNIRCKNNVSYENSPSETAYLKHSEYFFAFFKEIQHMLCDIIQCGINSFDLYNQIEDYASESQKIGLLILSQKLTTLYDILKAKNHSVRKDSSAVIPLICDIYCYVSVGQQKTELGIALENLNQKEKDIS